ncbi:MAG: PQQ-binding-like beta-propeller repeat protein [Herpetosiphonaceae bacterium]|nr:PQQ-binding-like beta-propeller repeat protein [Herpetosiphonaceae bacterium]
MIVRGVLRHGLLRVLVLVMLVSLAGCSRQAPETSTTTQGYDWLQFNGDAQHAGNNTLETTISVDNVGSLKPVAGFPITLPNAADDAPVYLRAVNTASGVKDLLFVNTKGGDVMALDARKGATVWSKQHPAGSCKVNHREPTCFTTSSPAIDPNHQYIYAYGLDGYVHKHQVTDGTEITSGGWPELTTLKPYVEKGSSSLTIATVKNGTQYLYVANSGYPGDAGDYQGHLTTINLRTGTQYVFNANCSNQLNVHFKEPPATPSCNTVQNAIWGRPGVVYDPDTDKLYMATGNGTYDPKTYNWGDSVIALHSDGTGNEGKPLDSYTPASYKYLDRTDEDLGSTTPAILPTPANSKIQHLALQSGKDAAIRLLNLDDLSSQGGLGHTGGEVGPVIGVPQGGKVVTEPAVWRNPSDNSTWAFVANGEGLSALRLTIDGSGNPSLVTQWQNKTSGSSPLVANGVVYKAQSLWIRAFNAVTGTELWHTPSGAGHWSSPIVVNGVLYVGDKSNHLYAFAINGIVPAAR